MALNAIDNSVNRASNIIENLLKFSRLTHDAREWINLKKLIIESIELNKKSLDEHAIVLDIHCDDDINIYMNNESLKHIFMNLIQNAIDAMTDCGTLQILCFADKDNVVVRIKDNGIGIEENKIDKIFEPFYTTKPIGKGTGLGLYIAYSEVQKANGEIKVESEKNKGTTFTISIPNGSE
jgi:polar amino acid transport system substrate-binding protein